MKLIDVSTLDQVESEVLGDARLGTLAWELQ